MKIIAWAYYHISAISLTLCASEFAELGPKEVVSLFGLAPAAWESGRSFGKRSIRGGPQSYSGGSVGVTLQS